MINDQKIFIERCPHDRENPYSQISRELIRDESISMGCRWMLIYLLSNNDGWKISVTQIWNHTSRHRGGGRDSVRGWIKEAIKAGYMQAVEYKENNLNRIKYFLSEFPKFKKSFPRPEFQFAEEKGPAMHTYKKEHNSSKEEYKNKHIKESLLSEVQKGPPTTQDPPPLQEESKKTPPEALKLANYLWDRIRHLFPKMKHPNLKEWANSIRLMQERDNRSWEDISKVIDFAMEDSFWCRNILSADKLRKQFDKLWAKMTPVKNSGSFIDENKDSAKKLYDYLYSIKENNKMKVYKDYIFIPEKNESVYFNMNPQVFEELLCKFLGVKKK